MHSIRQLLVRALVACGVVMMLIACDDVRSAEQFADEMEESESLCSIAALKSLYGGAPHRIANDVRIEGVVVSSDREGNFYKSLVLEDATGGVELLVDCEELYKFLFVGDRVLFSCVGLTLGSYGGAIRLGSAPEGDEAVGRIAENEFFERLVMEGHSGEVPMPHRLQLNELSPRWVGTLVRVEGVQFVEEALGMSWAVADEPTTHYLTDQQGLLLGVRTSPYALFSKAIVPSGSGYITGVLDYFGGEYQLRLSDLVSTKLTEERF